MAETGTEKKSVFRGALVIFVGAGIIGLTLVVGCAVLLGWGHIERLRLAADLARGTADAKGKAVVRLGERAAAGDREALGILGDHLGDESSSVDYTFGDFAGELGGHRCMVRYQVARVLEAKVGPTLDIGVDWEPSAGGLSTNPDDVKWMRWSKWWKDNRAEFGR